MTTSNHAIIYQNLLDTVADIEAGDDYHFTMAKVIDHLPGPAELAPLPLTAIVPLETAVEPLPCGQQKYRATFAVVAWIDLPFGCEPVERTGMLQADLEQALYADRTRGGQAVDTTIKVEKIIREQDQARSRLALRLEVWYLQTA